MKKETKEKLEKILTANGFKEQNGVYTYIFPKRNEKIDDEVLINLLNELKDRTSAFANERDVDVFYFGFIDETEKSWQHHIAREYYYEFEQIMKKVKEDISKKIKASKKEGDEIESWLTYDPIKTPEQPTNISYSYEYNPLDSLKLIYDVNGFREDEKGKTVQEMLKMRRPELESFLLKFCL